MFLKCYSMYTNKNHIIPEKYFMYKKLRLDYYLTISQTMCKALFRVPTAQGKQGKWPKKFPVRENTGNLETLPEKGKHREFCLLKL